MKNQLTSRILLSVGILFIFCAGIIAQNTERPAPSGAARVDAFNKEVFDASDESKEITKAIEFIKVEVTEIEDQGDGVTTEWTITNGDGEDVSKENALKQFTELLARSKTQSDNLKEIQAKQQPATDEVKSIKKPMLKTKASKAFSKGTAELKTVLEETTKQAELINQQITTIKALKEN